MVGPSAAVPPLTFTPVETMDLQDQFSHALQMLDVERSHLLVAVSGGADSSALLELLARSAPARRLTLTVAHVDHGISRESEDVGQRVAALAARHQLPFLVRALNLGAGTGETAARTARWAALEAMRIAAGADFIVTAHQADDQAETVLMRVLRGTGPAGLAAMAPRDGRILRPLLPFRRVELARYLHELGLASWSDPANDDSRHDRVWIRHQLLPMLRERWPGVAGQLNRVASGAAHWRRAWDDALTHLSGLDLQQEHDGISVAGEALRGYSSDMARAVLRALGLRVGAVMSGKSAERLLQLVDGRSGSWVPLGGGWRGALAFGRVRIERPVAAPAPVMVPAEPATIQWGEWSFRLSRDVAPAVHQRRAMTAWLRPGPVVIRERRPGDRLQPLGGPGHRTIARLMQEARVPLGQRGSWPVLELVGAPVWIPGICRSAGQVPDSGTEALKIDAHHR